MLFQSARGLHCVAPGGECLRAKPFVDDKRIGLVPGVKGIQCQHPLRRVTIRQNLHGGQPVGHIVRRFELRESQTTGIDRSAPRNKAERNIAHAPCALALRGIFKCQSIMRRICTAEMI